MRAELRTLHNNHCVHAEATFSQSTEVALLGGQIVLNQRACAEAKTYSGVPRFALSKMARRYTISTLAPRPNPLWTRRGTLSPRRPVRSDMRALQDVREVHELSARAEAVTSLYATRYAPSTTASTLTRRPLLPAVSAKVALKCQ